MNINSCYLTITYLTIDILFDFRDKHNDSRFQIPQENLSPK